MRIRRYSGCVVLALIIGAALAWAQESDFRIGVDVQLVSLEAFVLDANGRPVVDLS